MFALITFVIGLVVLFKGSFRLGSRTVSQRQSRSIAFMLMAPLVLEFCLSTVLVYNNFQLNQDGTISFSPDALDYVGGTVQFADLILVVGALGLVAFNIYGAKAIDSPVAQQATPTVTRVPDIMTVAEAAAYMRVTEREVLGLIDQGKLGAARIGDTYRIARIAIEDFMARS